MMEAGRNLTFMKAAGRERATQRVSLRIVRRALLVLLLAWPLLAFVAARALEMSAPLSHADVIVVLGGSSTYVERTHLAAKLFREGRAPKIILTNDGERGGWSQAEERNPLFIERAAEELKSAGVPVEKIVMLEPVVTSTHEEAALLRDYGAGQNLRSVILVTSAYHSRRALWTMQRAFAGKNVELGLATVAPGEQTPRATFWWLSAQGWRMVAGEYLKFIYYLLRYR